MVETVDELDEQRNGLRVALRDAAGRQTQGGLEPGELHLLVVGGNRRLIVAAFTICRSRSRDRPSSVAMTA